MRRFSPIFFFLCFFFTSAQKAKLDSLLQKLELHSKEDIQKVDLLNTIGFEYWIINSGTSITYGKQALLLALNLDYKPGYARAHRIIGVGHWAQGNQNDALKYLTIAQKEFSEIPDPQGVANTTLNIGMVYADLKEYDKALDNYNKAINQFTALGLKGRIATTYTKMGTIYIEKNNIPDATSYLTNALSMHTENNYRYGIAEAHNRLGILYIQEKEFEQAYHHLRKSIMVGKEVKDEDGLTNNLIQYGKLLRLDGKLEEANIHLNQGLEKAQKNNLKKYELLAYEELKELRKLQQKPGEALQFYDQYVELKDSIINTEKAKQIAYIEFKNELDNKTKELTYLKEKEKTEKIVRWSLILGILTIGIAGFLLVKNSRQQSQKSKELSLSREELARQALENAQLKQKELKQQLDFKNKELTSYAINFVQKNELLQTLHSIIQQGKKSTPKEKEKLINELAKIIRQNLNMDRDWEDFKRFFEEVHTGFYANLKNRYPDLSSNDLKICSLARLNLNIKETASILGISPESAKTARYRLRKKLNLQPDEELLAHLISLENH